MPYTIYQMIDTETGEIIPYEEWRQQQQRTCGDLLPDDGEARDPPRLPKLPVVRCYVRAPHPGDRLAASFFGIERG